jgi:2-amino-4-hydroxy-6-hydroxymethyldihydropteridine diphosphokinase
LDPASLFLVLASISDTLMSMRTVYIGMGGNLPSWAGNAPATLAAAASQLAALGRVVCRSSLYSTKPVGFASQPRFVNAVVALETELAPRQLLAATGRLGWSTGQEPSTWTFFSSAI